MVRQAVRLAAAVMLIMALLGIGVGRVAACRCADIDDAQALAKADVAFEGVVTGTFEAGSHQFMVTEPLQGPIEIGLVNVSSALNPRGCGIDFVVGQRWVIYASAFDATTLETDACSGSHLVAQQATGNESALSRDVGMPIQVIGVAGLLLVLAAVSLLAFGKRISAPPGNSR